MRRPGPDLSNWRSVRRWESATRERLRHRHALWLHGWCIGALVMLLMWGASHLQMAIGSDALALRYLVTIGVGYLAFLLLLRWWARSLLRDEAPLSADMADLVHVLPTDVRPLDAAASPPQGMVSGGGGDFGGGGAQASFADAAEGGSALSEVASGTLEAAGSLDEGAIVVVPVAAVFLVAVLVFAGAGSLLLLYFGSEVLLAVALELAFGYASARTAVRVAREGWLSAAVRLTWKPLLGTLVVAVLLGAALDHWVPHARSLPHAVQLLRAGP
ncbi:MAG TPA: hypothetical protein VNB23_06190 [Ramlibacter sp.]|nr:hypothetical protein [Ramlibacter sp.]